MTGADETPDGLSGFVGQRGQYFDLSVFLSPSTSFRAACHKMPPFFDLWSRSKSRNDLCPKRPLDRPLRKRTSPSFPVVIYMRGEAANQVAGYEPTTRSGSPPPANMLVSRLSAHVVLLAGTDGTPGDE